MKKTAILTSGGDSPGMNAAIRAAVRCAVYNNIKIYGVERGYEGLIDGDICELLVSSVADILQRGGTMLKTARSKRFMTEEGMEKACRTLKENEIDALIVIGGNGSLKGAADLTRRGVNVITIPATIDNDIAYTEFSIGFDTAVNTVLSAVSNIRDTSLSHERTTIIEVMGRKCGDIALYAGLAGGAEFVLIPEEKADPDDICSKILHGLKRGKKQSIIMNAEGSSVTSQELAEYIKEHTGLDVKIVVPGYIQRGGSPTANDRIIASRMGYEAIELIKAGQYSKAIGIKNGRIVDCDIEEAAEMTKGYNRKLLSITDMLSI